MVIFSIALVGSILFVIYTIRSPFIGIEIERASHDTRFGITEFIIYDKSPDFKTCDRLICIKPFDWYIWAKAGKVYILNDTKYSCPVNTCPAVEVPYERTDSNDIQSEYDFKNVCINMLFVDIINAYSTNSIIVHEEFEMEKLAMKPNKFTILDTLNYLFERYITMNGKEGEINIARNTDYATISTDRSKLINDSNLITTTARTKRTTKEMVNHMWRRLDRVGKHLTHSEEMEIARRVKSSSKNKDEWKRPKIM